MKRSKNWKKMALSKKYCENTYMKIFITILLLAAPQAWAIKYHQASEGSIKEIDAAAFGSCSVIYFRNAAKSELNASQQKSLVKASLKGELVNDLGALAIKLKSNNGACTYTESSEVLN